MKRYPKLASSLVWILATSLTFFAVVAATAAVGKITHSEPFGICGLRDSPGAGLVFCMYLGSIPFSIIIGNYAARRSYRYLTRDK
jgi:hypothetical protein